MCDDNLVSLSKLQNDIEAMKKFGFLLKSETMETLDKLEHEASNLHSQTVNFNMRFSPYGWCAYDRMNSSLMERANAAFENQGIEAAEKILISYYKSDVKEIMHWIKHSSEAFNVRTKLIHQFFEDHFAGRYYASIPLGLIIIDGAVNDFTKSKGFFAEGTSVDAWDCIVGCSNGLSKLREIFNQGRTKTNNEIIKLPYRHGILHGRDLNYANEYVSCKCVSLMFAVSDWMRMKSSENRRIAKHEAEYEKACAPFNMSEALAHNEDIKQIRQEIHKWRPRHILIGQDIPTTGTSDDYHGYPYIEKFVEMLYAWKSRNFGKLSNYLQRMFPMSNSDGKRAGECRQIFASKALNTFEIVEVEEQACALSKIVVKVFWVSQGHSIEANLTFGCSYESTGTSIAVPWNNDGEWVIIPWDINALYR